MTASRKINPWLEAASDFGKTHDSFVAIDPRTNPKAWSAWRDYFRWLNYAPFWFIEVERRHDEKRDSNASWTAPIDHPDKFTVSFRQMFGPPPVFPLTLAKPLSASPSAEFRRAHVERTLRPADKPESDLRKPWWQRMKAPVSYESEWQRYELEAQQQLGEDKAFGVTVAGNRGGAGYIGDEEQDV